MLRYLFPFELIEKNSRIVIYGAGTIGRVYVSQLLEANYCTLVSVVDLHADGLYSEKFKIGKPDLLTKINFDYVIIAIKDEKIAHTIRRELERVYDINSKKIIWVRPDRFQNLPKSPIVSKLPPDAAVVNDKIISIAVRAGAGFGDTIIAKKIVKIMAEHAQNCSVDIYAHEITFKFVGGLYAKEGYVNNIYRESEYKYQKLYQFYDLAFDPLYIFSLDHYNEETLKKKNLPFANLIKNIDNWINNSELSNDHPLDYSTLFARSKKKGYNAYTVYSFDGLLPINDNKVSIPLTSKHKKQYEKIMNGIDWNAPYITIKYGWGLNAHKSEYIPAKIWPFEYYQKLLNMIKNKYPNLPVVQIGRANTPPLSLVDRFFQDVDIEIIKYVLKNSILHIDSEGGMVHLATQLETKCLVAFGPTPVHFFGYDSNINVVSPKCSDCCYLDKDFSKCIRELKKPECMYSITPEMMFEKFNEYMATFK